MEPPRNAALEAHPNQIANLKPEVNHVRSYRAQEEQLQRQNQTPKRLQNRIAGIAEITAHPQPYGCERVAGQQEGHVLYAEIVL